MAGYYTEKFRSIGLSVVEKISSIIIAKNEEENIERCIKSQLNCIDDIVVMVDNSSTDGTYEIAASFNEVNCVKADWRGYAQTKQEGIKLTKHNWVFWIDADEEITGELADELNAIKTKNIDSSAFKVARRAYFLGKWIKHSGWYPSYVTRFFNKNYARFDDKNVHEGLDVNGKISKLNNDLNHYTDPTIRHYFNKFNRYTSLAAEELNMVGKKTKLTDIIFRPAFIFIKMYIFKRGFLDGLHGFILAVFSSAYVFTKYTKLWELNKSEK